MNNKNPLIWNTQTNKYTVTGSKALNELGKTPANGGPPGLPPDADETSSITSTGSTDSVQTIATNNSLETNASAGSTNTVNTDVDLSAGSSSSIVPPSTKKNYTTKKYLNKYGVAYDRSLPDLKAYRNRSVAKNGYDPKTYTKTDAANFHSRDGYIPYMIHLQA
jgi:hypothetical protein